ncbi:cyclic nucleotide-binding domain-containing protein [Desulfonatronum parangueonense]
MSNSKPLPVIEPSKFFGESAYLLDQPRLSTARAETDSELLLLSANTSEGLLSHSCSPCPAIHQFFGPASKAGDECGESVRFGKAGVNRQRLQNPVNDSRGGSRVVSAMKKYPVHTWEDWRGLPDDLFLLCFLGLTLLK